MKFYQTIILLCFFSMLFYNCSLPADDEEKGDLKGHLEKTKGFTIISSISMFFPSKRFTFADSSTI